MDYTIELTPKLIGSFVTFANKYMSLSVIGLALDVDRTMSFAENARGLEVIRHAGIDLLELGISEEPFTDILLNLVEESESQAERYVVDLLEAYVALIVERSLPLHIDCPALDETFKVVDSENEFDRYDIKFSKEINGTHEMRLNSEFSKEMLKKNRQRLNNFEVMHKIEPVPENGEVTRRMLCLIDSVENRAERIWSNMRSSQHIASLNDSYNPTTDRFRAYDMSSLLGNLPLYINAPSLAMLNPKTFRGIFETDNRVIILNKVDDDDILGGIDLPSRKHLVSIVSEPRQTIISEPRPNKIIFDEFFGGDEMNKTSVFAKDPEVQENPNPNRAQRRAKSDTAYEKRRDEQTTKRFMNSTKHSNTKSRRRKV